MGTKHIEKRINDCLRHNDEWKHDLSCAYPYYADMIETHGRQDAGRVLIVKRALTMDDVSRYGWTVLVVDSDGRKQRFFDAILSEAGFITYNCNTPIEAIDLLATRSFDVLLIDISPCDNSALRICRTIRELYGYSILIIAVIRGNDRQLCALSLQLGADDCITDPFHVEELVARIYARMRRKPVNDR